MNARRRAWTRLFEEERDAYLLGSLRLALALLLFLNCARLILELVHGGYFADYFHLPLIPESWLPSRSGYALMLGLEATAAGSAFIGFYPRESLFAASSIGLYVLACDRLQYHNNRYELLLLGLLLSFTPADRSFCLLPGASFSLPLEARRGPTFARRAASFGMPIGARGKCCSSVSRTAWRSWPSAASACRARSPLC